MIAKNLDWRKRRVREKASEIVLKCLEEKGISQRQLAARMGEKNSKGEIDSRGCKLSNNLQ